MLTFSFVLSVTSLGLLTSKLSSSGIELISFTLFCPFPHPHFPALSEVLTHFITYHALAQGAQTPNSNPARFVLRWPPYRAYDRDSEINLPGHFNVSHHAHTTAHTPKRRYTLPCNRQARKCDGEQDNRIVCIECNDKPLKGFSLHDFKMHIQLEYIHSGSAHLPNKCYQPECKDFSLTWNLALKIDGPASKWTQDDDDDHLGCRIISSLIIIYLPKFLCCDCLLLLLLLLRNCFRE
jgi:hypothetical protein